MIVLLDLLLRLALLAAAPERWCLVGTDGEVRCVAGAPDLDPAGRARLSHAWAWSDRAAPRRFEAARIGRGPLADDRARLAVSVAGWGRGRSGRVVAAPLEMWEELPEDVLPAWPVPAGGRLSVPVDRVRGWRLRLIEAGGGSWWLDVPAGRAAATLASAPAHGPRILLVGPDGLPVEDATLVVLESALGRRGGNRSWARDQTGEGVVRFPGLPDAEPVVAVVTSKRWAPAVLRGVPGDLPDRIELAPGAALSGRLADESGRPVAAAMVRLEAALPGGLPGYQPSEAASAADGTWRLEGVPPGRAALVITAPGFAPHRERLDLPAGALDLGTTELRRGVRLAVLVVDDLGAPVPGAEVDGGPGLSAVADARGLAELRGAPAGERLDIAVEAPGHLRARVRAAPAASEPVRTVLRRAFSVRGRLLAADGSPAESGLATWRAGQRSTSGPLLPGGGFELPLEPGMAFELTLASPTTPELRLRVEPGQAGEVRDLGDLRAPAGLAVAGRVVREADGTAVAGARIWLPRPSPGGPVAAWAGRDLLEARSGEDGSFRLAGLPAGPALLRIDALGLARAYREVQAAGEPGAADDGGTADVGTVNLGEVSLAAGGTVHVLAGDATEGALARLDLRGDWFEADLLVADLAAGRATFRHVPPGHATLSVVAGQRLLCEREVDLGAAGEEIEVECRGSGVRLTGSVLVAGRTAGPGRLLWLAPAAGTGVIRNSVTPGGLPLQQSFSAGRPQVTVEVAADGSFATEEVAAGRWQVLWAPAGSLPGPARVVDVPAAEEHRTLLSFAGSLVAGVVVDVQGAPVAGARVRSLADGALAFSGEDGGFELAGLPPGRRSLQASREELRSTVVEVEVAPERASEPVRLVLEDRRAPEIEVAVLDPDGAPVPGAFVFLEEEGRPWRLLTAGMDGRARGAVEEPPPVRLRAAALAQGRWALGEWRAWEQAAAGMVLRVGPAGSLTVESGDSRGAPSILSSGGWDLARLLTGLGTRPLVAPGRPLHVEGLPPGSYLVSLEAASAGATVAPGERSEVELE